MKISVSAGKASQKTENTQLPQVRCPHCNKLLGKLNGSYEIKCSRCKKIITGKI